MISSLFFQAKPPERISFIHALLPLPFTFKESNMSSSPEIFLTNSPDGPIVAYDASSGTVVGQFTGSRSPRQGLTVVGEDFGKTYIAASHISPTTGSGSIHLYNWWSSTAFHNLPVPEPVAPLAASFDGLYLFAGGISGSVHTLSVPSGNVLKTLPAHNKPVTCLSVNHDESLLISGSDDGTIAIVPIFRLVGDWACENVEDIILHKFAAHSDSVTAIVSGTGLCYSQIISCSEDSTCKFWSLRRGTHLRTVVFPCMIYGITLHPTEPEFYAAGSDGSIHIGSFMVGSRKLVIQGSELMTLPHKHNGAVVSVVMVNAGRNLVSASEDGSVWIWKLGEGQVNRVIMAFGNEMTSISDMVSATGIDYNKGHSASEVGKGGATKCSIGSSCEELIKSMPAMRMIEMEDLSKVAAKDRSRAIDTLESAIAIYEKLLELILKEAKKGTRSSKER
ncbi:protein ROOT INITIATION DEFECTIVE 3-like [Argentina anserina]|uniref:protein ROOT INITIATION DEFECTIVE 3-like n=1 Tax=Argentina anserina TaxID=57926 RepID=UPI0021762D4E|nr:protein ROOT INITIATION DEFECTIVE 3-like [Potentilla anserina]